MNDFDRDIWHIWEKNFTGDAKKDAIILVENQAIHKFNKWLKQGYWSTTKTNKLLAHIELFRMQLTAMTASSSTLDDIEQKVREIAYREGTFDQ